MEEVEEEAAARSASPAFVANTGDCCEALNAVAADLISSRRSTIQRIRSIRKSQDEAAISLVVAQARDMEALSEDLQGNHSEYKALSHLNPCFPVTVSFEDVSRE